MRSFEVFFSDWNPKKKLVVFFTELFISTLSLYLFTVHSPLSFVSVIAARYSKIKSVLFFVRYLMQILVLFLISESRYGQRDSQRSQVSK